MDVINLSLGGVQIDPSADALSKAVDGASRAGVVVVVAAGNSFGESGDGSIGSPGTAVSPITVAATTTTRWFGFAAQVMGPGVPPQLASLGLGASTRPRVPKSLASPTRVRWAGDLCRRLPGKRTDEVLVADLQRCDLYSKALIARAAGAVALVVVLGRAGAAARRRLRGAALHPHHERQRRRRAQGLPGRRRERGPHHGGAQPRRPSGCRARRDRLLVRRPDAVRPAPQARRLGAGSEHRLVRPGLLALPGLVRHARRHIDGHARRDGSAALLRAAHRDWTTRDIKAALMATATSAFADTLGTVEAEDRGRAPASSTSAPRPRRASRPIRRRSASAWPTGARARRAM